MSGFAAGRTPLERHRSALRHVPQTEMDALRAEHQFLRAPAAPEGQTWQARMATRYYRQLFREYALADLSRARKTGQVGLRWRTRDEVIAGRGQFSCGNKKCDAAAFLASYEVPFAYREQGESKLALVKLRLCPACALVLHHGKLREARRAADDRAAFKAERARAEAAGGGEVHGWLRRVLCGGGGPSGGPSGGSESGSSPGSSSDEGGERPPAKRRRRRRRDAGASAEPEPEPVDEEARAAESAAWSGPAQVEPTEDEEFDKYFMGLLS